MAINTKEATVGQDTQFTTVTGQGSATAVAAAATVAVTVDHSANVVFNLNTVPEVEVSNGANATLVVGEIHPDHFIINVTNNGAAAGDIVFNYSRTGI